MATTKWQRLAWVLLGVFAVSVLVILIVNSGSSHQMGSDEAVFKTVDALYTAVRNHDEKQLAACEQRLNSYKDAGTLPPPAAEHLAGIIARARKGDWDTAAQRLYQFMLEQRRDQTPESNSR